ncbi:PLP-dependent transferase, partial [Vibrio cholerae]
SFVLKTTHPEATTALLDGMQHFSMGFSWGGFESLILAHEPKAFTSLRSVANPHFCGTLLRVHIGLEDVEDLIADLEAGFARYNQILHA